jgi:hypothetical protein
MGPGNLRWAIRALIALFAVLLLAGLAVELAPRDEVDPAERVVMSYVKARRADDAAKACEQLSLPERRELVARISRTPPSQSSDRECEQHVLAASRWSELTRPALARFRVAGAEAKKFAPDVRLVTPPGFDLPILEVWKSDGQWRIDSQAAERSTFVRFCKPEGATTSECECVFDRARSGDPRVLDRRNGVMDLIRDFESGRRRALFVELVQRCDGGEPRPSA